MSINGDDIFDMTLPIEDRLNVFKQLSFENAYETLGILIRMYHFSGSILTEQFLSCVCNNYDIHPTIRLQASEAILEYTYICKESNMLSERNIVREELAYETLGNTCKNMDSLEIPVRIKCILSLVKHSKYYDDALSYYKRIIDDCLCEETIYGYIISIAEYGTQYIKDILSKKFKTDKSFRDKYSNMYIDIINKNFRDIQVFTPQTTRCILNNLTFIQLLDLYNQTDKSYYPYHNMTKDLLYYFIGSDKCNSYYRILSLQYLLTQYTLPDNENDNILEKLSLIALNENIEYNRRADAADILMQLGDEYYKSIGSDVIKLLGGNHNNIYENRQNAHSKSVENYVEEVLEFLSDIQCDISYEVILNDISVMSEYNKDIQSSLNRISNDNMLYSKYSTNLKHILTKLYNYICSHQYKDEMIKRLLEELVEMNDTCSTGFVSRLVNVISGFGDYNIKISWEEQITTSLINKLNIEAGKITENIMFIDDVKIKNMYPDNPDDFIEVFISDVLYEMTLPTSKHSERMHFSYFFVKCISKVRDEIYNDFKDYIDDVSFDLYFRKALMTYDGEK